MIRGELTVAICIPSDGLWQDDFGMCLLNMCMHIMTKPSPDVRRIRLQVIQQKSSLLPKKRQQMLQDAIAAGADYALFIDTDQTFGSNLLYALLRHWKPVVACNVATKSIPSSPTARGYNPKWQGGDCVFTDPDSHGLQEVWRIGCGIMLVDLKIMKNIPLPWFQTIWVPEIADFIGEDWHFCQVLQKHGYEIYIDQDISKHVGHLGRMEYTHDLVGEVVRQEDAAIRLAAENGTLMAG